MSAQDNRIAWFFALSVAIHAAALLVGNRAVTQPRSRRRDTAGFHDAARGRNRRCIPCCQARRYFPRAAGTAAQD